jgi:hypothetical protein
LIPCFFKPGAIALIALGLTAITPDCPDQQLQTLLLYMMFVPGMVPLMAAMYAKGDA